jgi:hypothetical protein
MLDIGKVRTNKVEVEKLLTSNGSATNLGIDYLSLMWNGVTEVRDAIYKKTDSKVAKWVSELNKFSIDSIMETVIRLYRDIPEIGRPMFVQIEYEQMYISLLLRVEDGVYYALGAMTKDIARFKEDRTRNVMSGLADQLEAKYPRA